MGEEIKKGRKLKNDKKKEGKDFWLSSKQVETYIVN